MTTDRAPCGCPWDGTGDMPDAVRAAIQGYAAGQVDATELKATLGQHTSRLDVHCGPSCTPPMPPTASRTPGDEAAARIRRLT